MKWNFSKQKLKLQILIFLMNVLTIPQFLENKYQNVCQPSINQLFHGGGRRDRNIYYRLPTSLASTKIHPECFKRVSLASWQKPAREAKKTGWRKRRKMKITGLFSFCGLLMWRRKKVFLKIQKRRIHIEPTHFCLSCIPTRKNWKK